MADLRRLPGPWVEAWQWQRYGACRKVDPERFFPADGERGPAYSHREQGRPADGERGPAYSHREQGRQGHLCGLHGSGGVPRVRTAGAGTARDLGWAVYGGPRSHPDRGSRRSSVCLTGCRQSRRRRPLPSPAHPARCGHRGHTSVDYARRVFGRALLASPANSPRSGWSVRAAWSAATPAAASRAAGVRRTPPSRMGPYWQWSANINGRTVTRRLTERQARRRSTESGSPTTAASYAGSSLSSIKPPPRPSSSCCRRTSRTGSTRSENDPRLNRKLRSRWWTATRAACSARPAASTVR
jgi:hypothetical protein